MSCWYGGTLEQDTVSGNRAQWGGGVDCYKGGQIRNSIVHLNPAGGNWNDDGGTFDSCCAAPAVGVNCVTNDPRFLNAAASDYRLRYASPCIDRGGDLAAVTDDWEGNYRPMDGDWNGTSRWDIGACEYNPQTADSNGDGIPDAWCHGYGLDANDPDMAHQNPDHDPFDNGEEYIADTDPTSAVSYLRITVVSNVPPTRVYFRSSSNRLYSLSRTTNLLQAAWDDVPGQTNVAGSGGLQALPDTNQFQRGFYRIGVRMP